MLLGLAACAQDTPEADRVYLEAAQQAAAWIGSTTVETPHGPVWPVDVFKPEAVRPRLGDGVAGIVWFFLELYETTREDRYLDEARRGADYLLATLPERLDAESYHPAATLYGSVPGAGVALYEVYRATREARYRDGALRSVDLLHAYARQHDGVEGWPPQNDVLNGNAGAGLFLLYAAREMGHAPSRDLALRLGRLLLDRARPEQGGLTWRLREDRDFVLPNFSHGAAGIGYSLATLYQDTGHQEFLDAARDAAEDVQQALEMVGRGRLVQRDADGVRADVPQVDVPLARREQDLVRVVAAELHPHRVEDRCVVDAVAHPT